MLPKATVFSFFFTAWNTWPDQQKESIHVKMQQQPPPLTHKNLFVMKMWYLHPYSYVLIMHQLS